MIPEIVGRSCLILFIGLLGAAWAGCSDASVAPCCVTPSTSTAADAVPNATVDLKTIDGAEFSQILTLHRDDVVLVDFWASWCDPCRDLFPHSVDLHDRLAQQGLTVISVSLDDPDDGRATAAAFLESQNASFDNYISAFGAGTESVEAFDLDGVLPEYKLYDRRGQLRYRFGGAEGAVDVEQLDQAVAELLAEVSP